MGLRGDIYIIVVRQVRGIYGCSKTGGSPSNPVAGTVIFAYTLVTTGGVLSITPRKADVNARCAKLGPSATTTEAA